MFDKKISPVGPISNRFHELAITTFQAAAFYVKQLPYGRTLPRSDFAQVLIQQKGTCSSKHALIKCLAEENQWPEVELHMVIYAMSSSNTPGIGNPLDIYGIPYIPEAHCVLSVLDEDMDLTSATSTCQSWAKDVLQRRNITPIDTVSNKIQWHRQFIGQWIVSSGISYTVEEVWNIRERCIEALSQV